MFVINLNTTIFDKNDNMYDELCDIDEQGLYKLYRIKDDYIKNIISLANDESTYGIIIKKNTLGTSSYFEIIKKCPEYEDELIQTMNYECLHSYIISYRTKMYTEEYAQNRLLQFAPFAPSDAARYLINMYGECNYINQPIDKILTKTTFELLYENIVGNSLQKVEGLIKFFSYSVKYEQQYILKEYIREKIQSLSKTKYKKINKNKIYRKYFL